MSKSKSTARLGRFFLKSRGASGVYYICWYERGQTRSASTGTSDFEAAQIRLAEHAIKNKEADSGSKDAPLAEVLSYYWLQVGQKLPSADMFRSAMHHTLAVLGDVQVSALTSQEQQRLIKGLRSRNLADSTINRQLGCIWAALNLYHSDGHIQSVPPRIGQDRWNPVLRGRDRTLSLQELARLLNCASKDEHRWRVMLLAIGTASRPTAIQTLDASQVDLESGVIHLNPEGRAQTKKRRPVVPMATTLAGWVGSWLQEAPVGPIAAYRGRPMTSRTWFENLAQEAGVECVRYDIRHTVITWLVRKKVHPDSREIFVGHKLPGSQTTANYVHLDPDYLRDAAAAIEELFQALAPIVTERDLLRAEVLDDQPIPMSTVSEVDEILNRLRQRA